MDIYSNPPPGSYLIGLLNPFWMPTEDGKSIRAVSVSLKNGSYWNSGYTILITLIFTAIGKIITDFVITYFPLRGNGNRHAILVAYYNTGDPISLLMLMSNYIWKLLWTIRTPADDSDTPEMEEEEALPNADSEKVTAKTTIAQEPETPRKPAKKNRLDWKTLFLTIGLWLLSALNLAASTTAGIIIPAELLMGNVARVNPATIFYPEVTNTSNTPAQKREAAGRLSSAASSKAIGTVEYSRLILQEKVHFNDDPLGIGADGRAQLNLTYEYELSGFDLGLMRAPKLRQIVTGSCQTQYDWLQPGSNATHDTYWLWKNSSLARTIKAARPADSSYSPPRAAFEAHPKNTEQLQAGGKGVMQFSIIPNLAGRRSRVAIRQKDPWYSTTDAPFVDVNATNTRYIIPGHKPAIMCSQTTLWRYGDSPETAYNPRGVGTVLVPLGLKLAPFWYERVFTREFGPSPPVVSMSRNLGYSNLASISQNFVDFGRVENSAADLVLDLQRLVLGGFVYSREVIRNTAMLNLKTGDLGNIAEVNGTVPFLTADFVLSSPDVQTLSILLLAVLPSLFVFLWVLILLRQKISDAGLTPDSNEGFRAKFATRSVGLSAVQLFRFLDEEISGKRRWDGRLNPAPYIAAPEYSEYGRPNNDLRREVALRERIPVSAQFAEGGIKLTSVDVENDRGIDSPAFVSKYAIPKLMPLYKRAKSGEGLVREEGYITSSSPTNNGLDLDDKIGVVHVDTGNSRSSYVPQAVAVFTTPDSNNRGSEKHELKRESGRYELAMTSSWRKSVKSNSEDPDGDWSMVQSGSKAGC